MKEERPTPLVEDLDGTRKRLEGWFSERRGTEIRISELNIPEATGMSNVTLLFDIHWQENGEEHTQSCVGRLQPEIDRPVFPSYDLSEQYHVMEAVGAHSDIPVPTLLGLEADPSLLGVQFYIMEFTPGRIPTDMPPYNMDGWMMHETTEPQRADMWNAAVDTMARYHQLDYKTLGYADKIPAGTTPLQQQLNYWQEYHDWAMEGTRHEIGSAASKVAAMSGVRQELVELQRGFAKTPPGAILDGRDIGTVVCPDAAVKFYVTASPQERARRRWKEMQQKGKPAEYDEILADIAARDARDMGREDSPLKPAADAHLLDTSQMDIETAFQQALSIVMQAKSS